MACDSAGKEIPTSSNWWGLLTVQSQAVFIVAVVPLKPLLVVLPQGLHLSALAAKLIRG
jgi:hypothetical protein